LTVLFIVLAIIGAYIIGSFPSPYIVGRLRKGVDVRQEGSRNMGAMNVFYKIGFAEGLLVLALDIGKGAAGVALARFLGVPEYMVLIAGAFVVIGHMFPVFLKFRGGRGGASCIGILIFLMPWGIPVYLGLFLLIMWITKFPTLSYSLAFLCFPFIGWFVYQRWELIIFPIGLLMLPLIKYTPRIREMREKGGGWSRVIHRKDLSDRL